MAKPRSTATKKSPAKKPARKAAPARRNAPKRAGAAGSAAAKPARAARLAAGPSPAATRRRRAAPPIPDARLLELMAAAVKVIEDKKGHGVLRIDLRPLAAFTDLLVIATGESGVQNRAIADGIEDTLRREHGARPIGLEGTTVGDWVLVDYGGLVINLFTPAARDHYALERLWADAPRLG